MKKFFSLLVMLAIVAGGGYFVINEFVKIFLLVIGNRASLS